MPTEMNLGGALIISPQHTKEKERSGFLWRQAQERISHRWFEAQRLRGLRLLRSADPSNKMVPLLLSYHRNVRRQRLDLLRPQQVREDLLVTQSGKSISLQPTNSISVGNGSVSLVQTKSSDQSCPTRV
jgi:hypothetical protein